MGKQENRTWRSGSSVTLMLLMGAVALGALTAAGTASAQTYEPGANDRKVAKRVDPEYPDTLKRLYIGGVVRVEVRIAANGSVLNTKLVGGSPILGQAAMIAIQQWKFVPGAAEQSMTVKIDFDPHR